MDVVNDYFRGLTFTRVDEKQGYVIYGAGVASGLAGGNMRYVLLFVPSHLAFQKQAKIKDLPWQNLQTRNLTYSYRLRDQPWTLPREAPDILLEVRDRKKEYSTYGPIEEGFPFEVLLLHDPRKKTIYQFNNKINLSAALGTFSAVFNYIGDIPSLLHIQGPAAAPSPVNIPNRTIPSIQNWFRGGGVTNQTTAADDLDDSFDLL